MIENLRLLAVAKICFHSVPKTESSRNIAWLGVFGSNSDIKAGGVASDEGGCGRGGTEAGGGPRVFVDILKYRLIFQEEIKTSRARSFDQMLPSNGL
jgi:hypothetical protein